ERPVIALELADSPKFVEEVLGVGEIGRQNRETAELAQHLDFIFIPLYASFFIAVAWQLAKGPWLLPAMICAVLAVLCDVMENKRILGMLREEPGSRPKPFGQAKWFFYFATLAAEGAIFMATFFEAGGQATARGIAAALFGALLIANGLGGVTAALKGSFDGI